MAKADRIEAAVYQRAAFAAICSPPALMQSPCPTRAEDGVNKFVHRLSSLCPRIKGGIKLKLYAVWPFFGILAGALVLLRVDRRFRIVDVEDVPVAYMEGSMVRVRAKAVGDLVVEPAGQRT